MNIICEICDTPYKDDYIVYDKDVQSYLCRRHYDAVNDPLNWYEEGIDKL